MPGLILFLSCTGLCAWRVASVLAIREPEPPTRLEYGAWIGILGVGFWSAQGHLLALVGRFSRGGLLAASLTLLVFVMMTSRRLLPIAAVAPRSVAGRAVRFRRMLRRPIAAATLLPLALLSLAVTYSTAALWVLPVSNHDALSYQFPKAMWLVNTGAFGLYPSVDLRITYSPDNYEMLVATVLMFLRSDRLTGLITPAALLLFLAASFILFKRVWRKNEPALFSVALMLASPVLFLHLTAHKNDILMAAFTTNAFVWLGRYAVAGGTGSAVVGIVALALAAGTKFHGLFVVLAACVLWWRAWRQGLWRPAPMVALFQSVGAALLFLSLGSAQYIANAVATGQLTGIIQSPTPNAMNTVAYPAYWQVPRFIWMFLTAPLFTEGQYFTVPWSGETWFWPAYELYFSHYGVHISILILLLPLGVWWSTRHLDRQARTELAGISLAAAVLIALNLVLGLRPYGGFAFIPRFLFFALPVLLVWTWCPAVIYLRRSRGPTSLALAASVLIPIFYIGVTVTRDGFSPLRYVADLWESPQLRRAIFHTNWRAATVLDSVARADAVVAIDAGYDGWTYPLFGEGLSRKVEMIPEQPGPYQPGPEVDWVAIDRGFSIVWGHPAFQSMNLARRFIDRGPLTEVDQRVYRSLHQNLDFKQVYFFPSRFQAIFRRVRPRVAATSIAGLE